MTRLFVAASIAAVVSITPLACESPRSRLESFYTQAGVSRPAAATSMVAAWRAKKVLLDDSLNLAFERLDAGAVGSTAFAGAVLDFAAQIEQELPQKAEFEILWFRIGGLAGTAAEKAYLGKQFADARSLVLAGPRRWQTDAYWMRHPGHDALASYVMFSVGEGGEALKRLRERPEIDGPVTEARIEIERAMRGGG